MAAAVFGRTQIQVKKTGTKTTVPDNPTARLMYYFDCICTCVEADNNSNIQRLRNYTNYSSLSTEEEAQLLILCLALSPDKLLGTILFPAEDTDLDGFGNDFFELSAISTKLVVAKSLLIGGQQKKVRKIMMFKKSWIEKNYLEPLRSFERRSRPALPSAPRPNPQLSAPPPRQQFNAPPPRQQLSAPRLRQQFNAPPPRQQLSAPRPRQQVSAPPPRQQFNAPSPRQQLSAPRPTQQTSTPRPTQRRKKNNSSCTCIIL